VREASESREGGDEEVRVDVDGQCDFGVAVGVGYG
jgi:hypothetical protein